MIKDVKLKKGMSRDEVNKLLIDNDVELELVDGEYKNAHEKHIFKCKCGNTFQRNWNDIKSRNSLDCGCVKYNEEEQRYKSDVEKDGDYEYIRSYRRGDILPDSKIVGDYPYLKIKHKYCGKMYTIKATNFINNKQRCSRCCGNYENSFIYYIEQVLDESLDEFWDYEKNEISPLHISPYSHTSVWIKCNNVNYHDSYLISCSNFIRAITKNNTQGCPYCHSKKIHPKDSFAQYHIDNTDKDFLEKYWDYDKNTMSPWEISPSSNIIKVWIKCKNEDVNELNGLKKKDYHDSYEVSCSSFTRGTRCSYCFCRPNSVHLYDSFGYKYFDLSQSWDYRNPISPFKLSCSNGNRYNFLCPECNRKFKRIISDATKANNALCSRCSSSKGEKRIEKWLLENNIEHTPQKEFEDLLGIGNKGLSYDFYLVNYNLLIEYQGEYHDGTTSNQTKKQFEKQQEHDRRKKQYAKDNNIELLEIWYWDFDNVEEILNEKLKEIK